jgi:hypothetical protein
VHVVSFITQHYPCLLSAFVSSLEAVGINYQLHVYRRNLSAAGE